MPTEVTPIDLLYRARCVTIDIGDGLRIDIGVEMHGDWPDSKALTVYRGLAPMLQAAAKDFAAMVDAEVARLAAKKAGQSAAGGKQLGTPQ